MIWLAKISSSKALIFAKTKKAFHTHHHHPLLDQFCGVGGSVKNIANWTSWTDALVELGNITSMVHLIVLDTSELTLWCSSTALQNIGEGWPKYEVHEPWLVTQIWCHGLNCVFFCCIIIIVIQYRTLEPRNTVWLTWVWILDMFKTSTLSSTFSLYLTYHIFWNKL